MHEFFLLYFVLFLTNSLEVLIRLFFLLLLSLSLVFGEDNDDPINRIIFNLRQKDSSSKYSSYPCSLQRRMEDFLVPGVSIAVANGGHLDWARSFGVREIRNSTLCDTNTLFQAASVSKPVSATILLNLVDKGFLDLDKPVNSYLKDWHIPDSLFTSNSPVTLRHLASHSAGMTIHGFPGYTKDQPLPNILQILNGSLPANTKPVFATFQPGTRFQYSGGGFCIIQLAMIETTGLDFETLAQRYIFKPISMSRSTFRQPLSEDFSENASEGHATNGEPVKGGAHIYPEQAAAGLWTTPSDLLRWSIALANSWNGNQDGFLSFRFAKEMLTRQSGNCGLGIFLDGSGDSIYFKHGGANAGFRSFLLFFPKTGNGIAIMCNGDGADELQDEIVRAVISEYGWK